MNDKRYIEIAVSHPGNRGIVIDKNELGAHLNLMPLFRSYFDFDEDLLEHFKIRKSIKGYKGMKYLNNIVLDIDKGVDSDVECLDKMRDFLTRIMKTYKITENDMYVCYSGRGYHVIIANIFGFEPSTDLHEIVKTTLERYFPEADSIYDQARLIRVTYTPNEKTQNKYFKTPFTLSEIFSYNLEEVREISSQPRAGFKIPDFSGAQKIMDIIEPAKTRYTTKDRQKATQFNPTSVVTCVQNMYNEGPVKGTRHKKLMAMASYYMRVNLPQKAVNDMLISWASNMEPAEVRKTVEDVFQNKYLYGCFNETMDKFCDKKCIKFPDKQQGTDALLPVHTPQEVMKKYMKWLHTDIDERSISFKNLYSNMDKDHYLLPTELIILLGNTGIGKTAFAQNLVALSGVKTLWLSLENRNELSIRRFAQIYYDVNKEELLSMAKSNDIEDMMKPVDHISITSIPPTIEDIRTSLGIVQPDCLVVDTMDCIKHDRYKTDSMQKMDAITDALRSMAVDQDIIVIGINHITKSDSNAADQGVRLSTHSAKHSSTIAQRADKVMALEGMLESKKRQLSILKSRDEERFQIMMEFNWDTFRYNQI